MTQGTALEIFSNPNDLSFTIGNSDDGKFAIGIFRGPGHNFKPLITSKPVFETTKDAADAIENMLTVLIDAARKIYQDPESIIGLMLNPQGDEIDDSLVLTAEMVESIVDSLKKTSHANTYDEVVAEA
jgi:hypothetical protein